MEQLDLAVPVGTQAVTVKTADRPRGDAGRIVAPVGEAEHATLAESDLTAHAAFTRLLAELEAAGADSALPDEPSDRAELNDFLIRLRLRRDS